MKYGWLLVLLASGAIARGDALVLDDGTRVEGKIHKDGDQWILVDPAGHETPYTGDQIKSFEFGGAHDADSADAQLASLRRSTANAGDLKTIISRYQTFLKNNAGTSAADGAAADLATWQQRMDEHCVKVGPRWMTKDELDALAATEAAEAQRIGDLIHQERMQEAQAALKQALVDDPNNPSALYLNGLVAAEQNQNAPARAAFEGVNKLIAHHAPTYTDLAIILCRQKQYPAAMLDYIEAMKSEPVNKLILDDVAETLAIVPPENRDSPPILKAAAIFTEQDKLLQQAQAQKGRVRWGANWIAADRLPQLQAEYDGIQAQLATLQAKYDKVAANLASDDTQVQSDQAMLNQYQSTPTIPRTNMVSGTITSVATVPLPQEYYNVQQDLATMQGARQIAAAQLIEIKAEFDHANKTLSVPRFTGELHLIGPEGTPIRDAAPATQPG